MTISEQIKVLCIRKSISVAELARKLNTSPQNFNAKLKRDNLSVYEMMHIADALEINYKQYFELENGDII